MQIILSYIWNWNSHAVNECWYFILFRFWIKTGSYYLSLYNTSQHEKYIISRFIKEIKYTVYVVSRPTRGALRWRWNSNTINKPNIVITFDTEAWTPSSQLSGFYPLILRDLILTLKRLYWLFLINNVIAITLKQYFKSCSFWLLQFGVIILIMFSLLLVFSPSSDFLYKRYLYCDVWGER